MLHSQEIRCSLALKPPSRHRNSMSRHGHVLVQVFRASQASGITPYHCCSLGFHIVRFFEHSLIRTMIAHSCSTFVRNLQWVLHLRHCVPSWICGLSSCRHLLGLVQLLPVSFHSVLHALVYLSRPPDRAVANELVTLRCVSLSVSASQGRKQRGTDLVRDTVRVHFHLAGVTTGSVSQEAVSVHIPGQRLSA